MAESSGSCLAQVALNLYVRIGDDGREISVGTITVPVTLNWAAAPPSVDVAK
jgi:hypothetical protein